MVAVGEVEGSEAKQKVFLEECKDLRDFTEVGIHRISIATSITDLSLDF